MAGSASGVHEDVEGGQAAKGGFRRGDVGDVEGQDVRGHACGGHFGCQCGEFGFAPGAEGDMCTLFGQRHGGGGTDARGRARHQRAAAVKAEGG